MNPKAKGAKSERAVSVRTARHYPLDLMDSPKFFGRWFEGKSWASWRVVLKALSGLSLTDSERQLFERCTGRKYEPPANSAWSVFKELWLICGRGSGKSVMSAFLVLALVVRAIVEKLTVKLAPGEKLTVMSISADKKQTRVVIEFVRGFIKAIPLLESRVVRETQGTIELKDGIVIEAHTASYRSTRGYSLLGVVCDELAFFRSEESSACQDEEILNALRPGLARVPESLLIAISSPWSRRGSVWNAFVRHYGKDSARVLVWQAESLLMNPTLDAEAIREAYVLDEAVASAEWGAQFRSDLESYVSREAVEAVTMKGRFELPPVSGAEYFGFCDPSGGSSDSMTLAVSHREGERAVLDCIRERRAPFSPDEVVQEFSETLKAYGIAEVVGDRYAGEWPRERFQAHGIEYVPSERVKSEIYLSALPLLNSGRVELLDHPRMLSQLLNLERRTARGGRDSVDHPPGQHDDLINAAAGAVVLVGSEPHFGLFEHWRIEAETIQKKEAQQYQPVRLQPPPPPSEPCPECRFPLSVYGAVHRCNQCRWHPAPIAPKPEPKRAPETAIESGARAQKEASGALWFLKGLR